MPALSLLTITSRSHNIASSCWHFMYFIMNVTSFFHTYLYILYIVMYISAKLVWFTYAVYCCSDRLYYKVAILRIKTHSKLHLQNITLQFTLLPHSIWLWAFYCLICKQHLIIRRSCSSSHASQVKKLNRNKLVRKISLWHVTCTNICTHTCISLQLSVGGSGKALTKTVYVM